MSALGPIPPGLLRVGSQGKVVEDLQRELKDAGFDPGSADGAGVFAQATHDALVAFQTSKNLTPDGVAGPATWTALGGDRYEDPSSPPPTPLNAPEPPSGDNDPNEVFGGDFSHYQTTAEFQAATAGAQWAALKATEGASLTDPSFAERWAMLGSRIQQGTMTLRVAYEFLVPGDGAAQAKHLLDTLGISGPLDAGTRLALDWEADALNDPQALKDAATYVQQVTGLWPLVYCQAGDVAQARALLPDAPIWEAKWTGSDPSDVAIVQYSDGPNNDHDVFNGDLQALQKFAGFNP